MMAFAIAFASAITIVFLSLTVSRLAARLRRQVAQPRPLDDDECRDRAIAARNDAILRSSMDGFFVLNDEYRFVEVNLSFARMMGYSQQELLALKITDLEVADAVRPARHGTGLTQSGLHQFPTAHRHRHGTIVHLEISAVVLRIDGKRLVVGFARDITERLRAEEALATLMHERQLILQSTVDGIVGLDREGRVTFSNPAAGRILGSDVLAAGGRFLAAVQVADRPRGDATSLLTDLFQSVIESGATIRQQAETLICPEGAPLPIEFSMTPIVEDRRVTGAVLTVQDVSERRAADERRRDLEHQVHRARKMEGLGMLAGGIAHDFNNLLVGILGNASLAASELPVGHPVRARVDRILNAGQRASKIIHQIRAYTGLAMPDTNPIILSDMIREHVDFVAPTLPPNIALSTDLTDAKSLIVADSGQIEQLLTNLTVNAVEAVGRERGTVVIGLRRVSLSANEAARDFPGQELTGGDYMAIQVRDSGRGMSAESLARIFEPFYSSKGAGRGLGLAAIQGIIRGHGGGIRVASRLGQGTTFEVLFPATHAEMPAAQSVDAPPMIDASAAPRTLLVIDDEEDIRDVAQAVLETRGFNVLTAVDGPEGITVFARNADAIDAVLLDMTMPGMDGREVMTKLRAIRGDVRIIISSGYSESELASRIGASGVGFVRKPYTVDALVNQISAALAAPAERG